MKILIKNCIKCNTPFYVNSNIAWNTNFCIKCRKENRRKWKLAYEKRWYQERPGLKSQICKQYYQKHKEEIKIKQKAYIKLHPQNRMEYWRKYNKKASMMLKDAVIKSILVATIPGLPRDIIPNELINQKRHLIFLNRIEKKIRKEIKNDEIRL